MKLTKIFAAVALVVAAGAASAATASFDFSNLTWTGSPKANVGFLPSNGDGFKCTSGDICSSDVNNGIFSGDLTFKSGLIDVTATGYYDKSDDKLGYLEAAVVQDHREGTELGAGLGVYHADKYGRVVSSDDNITTREMLKMSFVDVTYLNSINLRSDGHNTKWDKGAVFEYSVDALAWTTASLVGTMSFGGSGLQSKDFYFRFGDHDKDKGTKAAQFYLAGMTVTKEDTISPPTSTIPEPETYAMMLAGLGLMGAIARRRKAKAV